MSLSGMLSGKLPGNQLSRMFAFGFSADNEILSLSLPGPLSGTLPGNQQSRIFAFGVCSVRQILPRMPVTALILISLAILFSVRSFMHLVVDSSTASNQTTGERDPRAAHRAARS